MTPAEELERGRLAAEVLENPAYKDAQRQIRDEIVSRWQAEKDGEARDWLWTMIQASKRLDSVLRDTMQTGLLRQQQVELHQSKLQRMAAAARRFI